MVGPLKVFHLLIEQLIIVDSAADVDDKIIFSVILSEVMRHIFNSIPICLLEEVRGWEGHSDDSFRYVGKVQLNPFIICGPLGPGHYFPDQLKHE